MVDMLSNDSTNFVVRYSLSILHNVSLESVSFISPTNIEGVYEFGYKFKDSGDLSPKKAIMGRLEVMGDRLVTYKTDAIGRPKEMIWLDPPMVNFLENVMTDESMDSMDALISINGIMVDLDPKNVQVATALFNNYFQRVNRGDINPNKPERHFKVGHVEFITKYGLNWKQSLN